MADSSGTPGSFRIANAPCSWGALEFDGVAGEQIGYGQMLDELKASGYSGTELGDWGYMPTDPAALAPELAGRGLTMVGAFVPVALKYREKHAEGAERAVQTAHLLRAVAELQGSTPPLLVLADENGSDPVRTANAGRITPAMGLSEADWQTFAAGAEHVARCVQSETGLEVVFHHHCAGYVETPDEIARLLSMTNPDLLGLVFDTGHYLYGAGGIDGQRVMDGLERFGERIGHVHFKDCSPAVAAQAAREGWDYFTALRHGVFCELGKGAAPFAATLAWLRAHNYYGWIVVEQDVLPGMGRPFESAQRNREYLYGIGV